jgi:hypothetical protein
MKILGLVALIFVAILFTGMQASAEPLSGVKITPYGVKYPLTRPTAYSSSEADPYQRSFGIRRWLRPLGAENDDYGKTLARTQNWLDMYCGYGVLGNGEAVFTSAGARWRRTHRGSGR